MKSLIDKAIQNLKDYSDENLYTILQIKFWLSENIDLYDTSKLNWNNDSCFDSLPCYCTLNNDWSKFISLYEALNNLTDCYKIEGYLEKELIKYQNIKDNLPELKNWVGKNEKIGASDLVCFMTDYLDYSSNPYYLKVTIPKFTELEVFVDIKHFTNTLAFLKIFNKLYWEDKILS